MSPESPPPPKAIKPPVPEEVAALLVAMGRERAAKLLAHFSPDETRSLRDAGGSIRDLPQERFDALVGEMENTWLAGAGIVDASRRFADLLEPAPEPEPEPDVEETPLLENVPGPPDTWQALGAIKRDELLAFLQAENPAIAAFVLLQLEATIAAEILASLDNDMRASVATAMIDQAGPPVPVRDLAAKWLTDTFELAGGEQQQTGEPGRVADIVNRMSAEKGDALLASLKGSTAADRFAEVESRVFRFDDIVGLSQTARAKVFDRCPADQTVLALTGADETIREAALSALGQRARRMIESELEGGAQVKQEAIDDAQRMIADLVLSLVSEGAIELPKQDQAGTAD